VISLLTIGLYISCL